MLSWLYVPNLLLFLYLQLLDVLTTLIGFSLGVSEGSPFVRALVRLGPVAGTLGCKLLALGIVFVCYRLQKPYLVRWINLWYAALVFWNACVILRVLTNPV